MKDGCSGLVDRNYDSECWDSDSRGYSIVAKFSLGPHNIGRQSRKLEWIEEFPGYAFAVSLPFFTVNFCPRQMIVFPAKPATHSPKATASRNGSSQRPGSAW